MKFTLATVLVLLTGLLIATGCGDEEIIQPEIETSPDGKIFIMDLTGKQWDITHAVNTYGMVQANWGHGLGQYAITPINDPVMLPPGDRGYPADDFFDIVLGVSISGDARAYSIIHLTSHEVVNDFVGGSYVAPVY